MSGPVETYDAIVAELRAKARNAAARNKPTMWAYCDDTADGLEAWFAGITRTDGAYAGAALALVEAAQACCPAMARREAAEFWALSVYGRRILRGWGVGAPRANLAWLRERAQVERPAVPA